MDPMIVWAVIITASILVMLLIAQVIFLLQGPPFVPCDDQSVQDMVALAKKYKPKRILDMGSGDGKLLIALGQAGFHVDGVEINPFLVRRAKAAVKKAKLRNITIVRANFWNFDVSEYDMIVLYVVKLIMPRLQRKLQQELPEKAIIISNYAEFPGLRPVERKNLLNVYQIHRKK
jgi:SAM-dependent methyltransferase